MKYPIAIEPGSDTQAWGVVVPDLPGCYSAADEGIDQAIENAKEAIELWIEAALDSGSAVPAPTSITALQEDPEFKNWIWAIVEIDPAVMDESSERINISLPRRIIKRLDDQAKAAGETRSGHIASLAIQQATYPMKTRIAYKTLAGEEKTFLHESDIHHPVSARIALVKHLGLTRLNTKPGASIEISRSKLEAAGIDPESVEIVGKESATHAYSKPAR